ncbi:DUF1361 domain-containing protein [Bacillus horti]|uniref:Membrane protein n=1 Tax=Caldalkalibacillus horti TaxID=77523 RepID=A0ABT9VXG6_9BACI|nr:DUF1361 domain-containing protein [Bacillus horti]MDQ0165659.1 putative membrane protein [Bacillus horti]
MDSRHLFQSSRLVRLFSVYAFLSIVGCAMVLFRIVKTEYVSHLYLIWNLFLAWLPFLLALLLLSVDKKNIAKSTKSFLLLLIGAVWLFFFPNAPYMITDYIHLGIVDFYKMSDGKFVGYNPDLLAWYDLAMISLFIFIGVIIGYISLFLVQALVAQKKGALMGYIFVVGVLFLSSFGIYLGRFIRWNTWDIVMNPLSLLVSVVENIHAQAVMFTLLFGGFLTLLYIALHTLLQWHKSSI